MVPQKSIKPSIKIGLMNLMPVKPPTETQILRMFGRSPAHVDVTLFVPDTYAAKNTAPEYLSKFYKRWSEIKSEKFDGFIMTGAPIETLPFEEVVLRIRMRAPGQTRIATRCFARYPALRIGSSSSWPAAAAACNIARPAGRVLEGARGLFRARSGDRRRTPHPLLGRHGLPLPLPQGRLPLHTARKRSERSGGGRPPIRRNSSCSGRARRPVLSDLNILSACIAEPACCPRPRGSIRAAALDLWAGGRRSPLPAQRRAAHPSGEIRTAASPPPQNLLDN